MDGQIYAMAGESPEHGAICTSLSGQLYSQLRGKPCQVFSKDMKVRSGPIPKPLQTTKGLYSYPDVLVVYGELEFHDQYRDVLLNPTVVIEALSPATETFDRGEKWARYQTWLLSLVDYVLVWQSMAKIEHYLRQPNAKWLYSPVSGLEGSLHLASVDCIIRLAEVYDRIVFPVETSQDADEQ
jgi:Uma2 family endonuclease